MRRASDYRPKTVENASTNAPAGAFVPQQGVAAFLAGSTLVLNQEATIAGEHEVEEVDGVFTYLLLEDCVVSFSPPRKQRGDKELLQRQLVQAAPVSTGTKREDAANIGSMFDDIAASAEPSDFSLF